MKNAKVAHFALFSVATICFPGALTLKEQGLVWDSKDQELVCLTDRPSSPFSFRFTNAGEVPIHLEIKGTSCECTSASIVPKTVPPGAKGEVIIRVATSGRRGVLSNWVEIEDEKTHTVLAKLSVVNKVELPVEVLPNLLIWEKKDQEKWQMAVVKSADPLEDFISSIECSDKRVEFELKPGADESTKVIYVRSKLIPSGTTFTINLNSKRGRVVSLLGTIR